MPAEDGVLRAGVMAAMRVQAFGMLADWQREEQQDK